MKEQQFYTEDWLAFRSELEDLITDITIVKNDHFFRVCWDMQITPERAVRFLTT